MCRCSGVSQSLVPAGLDGGHGEELLAAHDADTTLITRHEALTRACQLLLGAAQATGRALRHRRQRPAQARPCDRGRRDWLTRRGSPPDRRRHGRPARASRRGHRRERGFPAGQAERRSRRAAPRPLKRRQPPRASQPDTPVRARSAQPPEMPSRLGQARDQGLKRSSIPWTHGQDLLTQLRPSTK